jgi:hypothetical protein
MLLPVGSRGAALERTVVLGGHELIEMVESYLEYRFRTTEGMSL